VSAYYDQAERVMKVTGTGGFTDEDVQDIIAAFRKAARR
jgi:hypothetical protein